jgi:ATP-binding cassette subfamily B protein
MFWYGSIGAVIATIVGEIIPPLIIARAFNHMQTLTAAERTLELSSMTVYIYSYLIVMFASIVVWRTQAYATWKYSILAERDIYIYLFDHVQRMGSKFHANRFGGALVSQVNKFVGAYDRSVADFTWNILTGVTAFVVSLGILFAVSPVYALVLLAVSSIFLAVIYHRMKYQAPFNRRLASSESEQTAKLADNITNIATVSAFAGEDHEYELFKKQANTTKNKYLQMMNVQMKNELITQSSTNTLNFLAVALGIIAITKLGISVGTLYLIIIYTINLTNRLWQSMFVVRNINRAFGDAAEMTEILQLEPEVKDVEQPVELLVKNGNIRFDSVNFKYTEKSKDTEVFNNLDLEIKGGEKVGLVGHSGGGKTTITKLLLRFADIQSGTILIDGVDISKVRQTDLRKSIIYVPQEPLLFHRSLADNIRYGKLSATHEEVVKAAKLAHADEFISQLSEGYETLVGERGVKLSGGQRQRVAIARAMLKDAPILVLDEATSALDSESEKLIQDALWKLMDKKTAIVIAHRLSTIQKMDRIVVLENGQIAEQGSHKELLDKNGIYAKLWSHQSGGFLEE